VHHYIAGGAVRSVLELAGVQNVLAKRLGSRSCLNNARVTLKALSELRTMDDYAAARGIPLDYMLS
jgi:small subunit ribosomal protein S5